MQPQRDPQQPQTLRRRSTNMIKLVGVRDDESGAFPTDAVVRCTVRTLAGVAVPGATDLEMAYLAGTTRFDTTYRAMVSSMVDLPDPKYSARITWTLAGADREFNIPCNVIDG